MPNPTASERAKLDADLEKFFVGHLPLPVSRAKVELGKQMAVLMQILKPNLLDFIQERLTAHAEAAAKAAERRTWEEAVQFSSQRMTVGGSPSDEYEQGMHGEARIHRDEFRRRAQEPKA